MTPPSPPLSQEPLAERPLLAARLSEVRRQLERRVVDKSELVRLLLLSVIAGEHLLLVGPPGTAKSALVRAFSQLIDARYFEYLLTRFTEPNELFGPIDLVAFRAGSYRRRTQGMLPEAEVVFLDEIFRSNSAILNALLTLLNERRFAHGAEVTEVPLLSLFGATNEVPTDDALAAVYDRFLVRAVSTHLDSYHFQGLIERGLAEERARVAAAPPPLVSAEELRGLQRRLMGELTLPEAFVARYKGLVFQIRAEGIPLSDRRIVKLLKLFAASALLDGRTAPDDGDLFILKHVWSSVEQVELLAEIVNPVIERHYREHPEARPDGGGRVGLDALLSELGHVRSLLQGAETLSDLQLFAQLKNLSQLRAALVVDGSETARRMVGEVDQLLESVFASSKFA
jgi:MoxR-like ATPase